MIELSNCVERAAVDHCDVMIMIRWGEDGLYLPRNWYYSRQVNFRPEVVGTFAGLKGLPFMARPNKNDRRGEGKGFLIVILRRGNLRDRSEKSNKTTRTTADLLRCTWCDTYWFVLREVFGKKTIAPHIGADT